MTPDELRRTLQGNPELRALNPGVLDVPRERKTEARRIVEAELRQRLENKFAALWEQAGGPMDYVRNLKFDQPNSGMEFDFAWPDLCFAVEINGGQWGKSGHSSGRGLRRDAAKQNAANAKGWRLFVLTSSMVTPENVAELVRLAQEAQG